MSYVDNVNHPSHYESETSIECIDAMELFMGKEGVIQFCMGNAFKYIWRYKNKGKPGEDLKKAEWYIIRADELNDHLQKTSRFPVDYSTEINRLHDIWSIYYNREAGRIALENDYLYENGQIYKEDGEEVVEDKNVILTWGERESMGNRNQMVQGCVHKQEYGAEKQFVYCPHCGTLQDITDIFDKPGIFTKCKSCEGVYRFHTINSIDGYVPDAGEGMFTFRFKDEVEDDNYIAIWGEAWIDGKIVNSKAHRCCTSPNSPRKCLVHCPYCNRLNDITDIFRTGISLGVNCDTCDRRFAIHNSKDEPEINENTGEEMVEVIGDE